MPPAPLCSIVTVTFNAPDYVRRFLDSIAARTRPRYELIVIDNASEAPTRALLAERAAAGKIRLVQNEDNPLWAKSCNQGLALCDPRSRYLLLLNPDCEALADDWIERLAAALEDDPKVGVVGIALNWKRIGPVFGAVDGQCFFMRREAFDAVGPLDAGRYPWNGAPFDWCARAFAKGWIYRRVANDPPFLVHHGHKSVAASGKEHPWRPVDVEEMYRRAGLAPTRPHRLSVWMRRRFGAPYFFEPRAPRARQGTA
jgi:GT2 family glycosyltransferase